MPCFYNKGMDKQERYDHLYMDLAVRVSLMSHAERAKVGAIVVKDDNIISFGWNGTPKGFDNSCEYADFADHTYTRKEVIHAEQNCIAKLAKSGHSSDGATLYVTLSPCFTCSTSLIQSGIKRVVYKRAYHTDGCVLLEKAGIEVSQIKENDDA